MRHICLGLTNLEKKQPYLKTHLFSSGLLYQVLFYNCITSIVREIIYASIFTLEQVPVKPVDLDRITQMQVKKVAFLFKFRHEDLGIWFSINSYKIG